MKKRLLTCAVTAMVLMCLFCVSAFAADTVNVQVTGRVDYAMAEEVFSQLNAYRQSLGLKALVLDEGLTGAAMQRAVENSVYYSHTRPNGTDWHTIITQVYGSTGTSAENIAAGQTSATGVMNAWKNSSGHDKNMRNSTVTHVGIGCVYVDGAYYWVQLFSTKGVDNINDYSGKTNAAFLIQVDCQKNMLVASEKARTVNLEYHPDGDNSSKTFSLNYKYNAADSQLMAHPVPTILSVDQTSYTVKDALGNAIATISLAGNGESSMIITPLAVGTATVELPIYPGQTDPVVLTLAITEEHVHNYIPHVYEPTCVDHGWTFYQCSGCGHYYTDNRTEATGIHDYGDWEYQREPTRYYTGVRYKGCKNCNDTIWEEVPPLTNPFVDVDINQYYGDPVLWAVLHEITSGTDTTHFSPNSACTRAQIVTFLWRANGQPAPTSYYNPFTDVNANDYYYTAVLWAVEQGITAGTGDTTFSPGDPCTRAQAVTFLWRCAGSAKDPYAWNYFIDVNSTNYYYDAVLWAVDKDITVGTDAIHFSPEQTCTRAQIVTFLYRFMT